MAWKVLLMLCVLATITSAAADSRERVLFQENALISEDIDVHLEELSRLLGGPDHVVQIVSSSDLVELDRHRVKRDVVGRAIAGAVIGSTIGGLIGSLGGPVGHIVGRIVGAIIGFIVALLCFWCAHDDPPPDTQGPNVRCPSHIYITADSNTTEKEINFPWASAHDGKEGDVSKSVNVYSVAKECQPFWRGTRRRILMKEGDFYYLFMASDSRGNRGFCEFKINLKVLRCDTPTKMSDAWYSFNSLILGSTCTYDCTYGYRPDGVRTATCQESGSGATWSHPPPKCLSVQCPTPPDVKNGSHIITGRCTADQCEFGTQCKYTCDFGHDIQPGSRSTLLCGSNGKWDSLPPVCKDTLAPRILNCPSDLTAMIPDGKSTANVKWTPPQFSDNSGSVTVKQVLGKPPNSNFPEGIHSILYQGTDPAGNYKECSFAVFVRAATCGPLPVLPNMVISDCSVNDYIGSECQLECQHGLHMEGIPIVRCKREDPTSESLYGKWAYDDGLKPRCRAMECANLTEPNKGGVACDIYSLGKVCKASCETNYGQPKEQPSLYHCSQSGGFWQPTTDVFDCTSVLTSNTTTANLTMTTNSSSTTTPSGSPRGKRSVSDIDLEGFRGDVQSMTCGDLADGSGRRVCTFTLVYADSAGSGAAANYIEKFIHTIRRKLKDAIVDVSAILPVCPSGSVPGNARGNCVPCPRGYLEESNRCKKCPLGTFQSSVGKDQCEPCPVSQSTRDVGSETVNDCKDMCAPGRHSDTGMIPCMLCPIGSYATGYGAKSCTSCSKGTTLTTGASIDSDCVDVDIFVREENGVVLNNNTLVELASPISVQSLTFAFSMYMAPPAAESRLAMKVLSLKFTMGVDISLEVQKDGRLRLVVASWNMTTQASKRRLDMNAWNHVAVTLSSRSTGSVAELYINGDRVIQTPVTNVPVQMYIKQIVLFPTSAPDTVKNPLFSYLTGLQIWNTSLTSVALKTLSTTCLEDADIAGVKPIISWAHVIHHGSVVSSLKQSTCSGSCGSHPCVHGNCSDIMDDYRCRCEAGYEGKNCDVDIDDCAHHSCKNGATCRDHFNKYSCACANGYTGVYCETEIVHGGWSNWTDWSACSASCGGGHRIRLRFCDNPKPYYGNSCQGNDTERAVCNTRDCPECIPLVAPQHGHLNCHDNDTSRVCVANCSLGYYFSQPVPSQYVCGRTTSYMWNGQESQHQTEMSIPDCTPIDIPREVKARAKLPYAVKEEDTEADIAIKQLGDTTVRSLPCVQEGSCVSSSFVTTDGARRKRSVGGHGTTMLTIDVASSVKVPKLKVIGTAEDGTVNVTVADLIKYINESTQNYRKAVQDVDNAMRAIRNKTETKNMEAVTSQGVYRVNTDFIKYTSATTCPPGTMYERNVCVECSPGSHEQNNVCVLCPVGTYQPEARQISCRNCPQQGTTVNRGARNESQCLVFCKAGTYKNGDSCTPCPLGHYQSEEMQDECVRCPGNRTTVGTGAKEEKACMAGNKICKNGSQTYVAVPNRSRYIWVVGSAQYDMPCPPGTVFDVRICQCNHSTL